MNDSIGEVTQRTRGLVLTQVFAAIVAAAFFGVAYSFVDAYSALYGAFTSIAGTLLLSYDVRRASKRAVENPKGSMGILYFGAVQRFVLILVLLVFGLAVLKLQAVATLVGFAVAQFGYVLQFRKLAH